MMGDSDAVKTFGDIARSAFKTKSIKPEQAKAEVTPKVMSEALERRKQSRPSAYDEPMPENNDAVAKLGQAARSGFGKKN